MEHITRFAYKILPKPVLDVLGRAHILRKWRDRILRPGGKPLIATEQVKWGNGTFLFRSPLKLSVKAKRQGIESTLLRASLTLLAKLETKQITIIDVGANYGFVSLALHSNLGPDSRIYAFEPHPQVYKEFSNSIDANHFSGIVAENLAVGGIDSEIVLNLCNETANVLDIYNTESRQVRVMQTTLDNYAAENGINCDFVKIDVDGYEMNVLQGMTEMLVKTRPIIVIETNGERSILDWMQNKNYQLYDMKLDPLGPDIPPNVFCLPN